MTASDSKASAERAAGWRRLLSTTKRLLILLVGLLLLLALLVWWLVFTGSGLRTGLALVNRLDAVTINAVGLEGDLAELAAEQLTIETAAARLDLQQLRLQTRPLALLKGVLQIDQLVLAQLQITTRNSPAPQNQQDSVAVAEPPLSIRAERIAIDRILVNDLDPIAKLQVQLALSGDQTWQHELALSAQLPQLGQLTASIAGDRSHSSALIELPAIETSLQIDFSDWLADATWLGTLRAGDLSPLGVPGELVISGAGNVTRGELQVESQLFGHRFVLDSLNYQRVSDAIQLNSSGTFDGAPLMLGTTLGSGGLADGKLVLTAYQPDQRWRLSEAVVSIAGPWQQLALQAQAIGEVQAQPFQLDMAASLVQSKVAQIHQLAGSVLGGEVNGQGQLDWSQQLIASGQLSAQSLALNHIDSRLPTSLSFDLAADWQPERLQAELNRIDATIADSHEPVTGAGQLEYLGKGGWSGALQLAAGADNHLQLTAPSRAANQASPIHLELALGALGTFIRGANGSGQADLQIDPERYLLEGTLLFSDLSIPTIASLGELRLDAAVVDGVQQLDLQGSQLVSESAPDASIFNADELSLVLRGNPEQHQFVADIRTTDTHHLNVSGSGSRRDQGWAFRLDQLSAQLQQLEEIRLRDPVEGAIAAQRFAVSSACFDSLDLGSICAQLQQSDQSLELAAKITLFDQAPALPILLSSIGLPALELSEGLQLDAQLHRNGDVLEQLKVVGVAPGLRWPRSSDGAGLLLSDIQFDVDHGEHTDQKLRYQLRAALAGGRIDAAGLVVDPLGSASLDGRLQVVLPELAALSLLSEELDLSQGLLNADFAVSGPLAAPLLSGSLRVDDTLLSWPGLGVEHTIQLQLQLDQQGQGSLTGQIGSGQGKLTVAGDMQLPVAADSQPSRLEIGLVGDQFLLVDTEDLAATASSNLRLSWVDGGWKLMGEVSIDQAFSNLAVPSSGGVVRSPDVVIVDATQDDSPSPASAQGAIDITVGFTSPGKLDGLGLSGEIDGKLRLTQRPGNPLLANGQLNLSGSYRAFGQELEIEQGELIYVNSPVDQPTIAVLARRVIDDVSVGVRVSGPASALVTRLESEPVMSESDMLHYLVLGRAPDATSAPESEQLSAAAIGLALRRSQGSVAALGEQLGATEFGLTQELGGLALAVGKQLSPKLYIGYTVGLLEPIDVAQIRYQINRHWSLQSEIAEETRAGIRYRIEKD